jgi:hypothetical protein
LNTIIDKVPATIFVKDANDRKYLLINGAGEKYLIVRRENMSRKETAQGSVHVGISENALMEHGRLPDAVLLLAKPYRKSELARMVRQALETSQLLGAA